MNNSLLSIPAHLWIGSYHAIRSTLIKLLQQQFCSRNGCTNCSVCQSIIQEQHHAIVWIRPEKQYTRDILVPLFEQLSFTLPKNEPFFFVLENIDFMSAACANSLLKSLEEPPPGYYFFLCAGREHTILPTIRSRCITHTIATSPHINERHPLFLHFSHTDFYDPLSFLKDLEQSPITEQESIELVDALFAHWLAKSKEALQKNDQKNYQSAREYVSFFSGAFQKLPMPGSSKIFWKNAYLAIK